jgi:hypothetical protein
MGNRLCLCGERINRGPGQHAYCSEECRPVCTVEGCQRAVEGRAEYCKNHNSVWMRNGGAFKGTRWTNEYVCVVCGATVQKNSGRRKHCSGRCQAMDSRSRRGSQAQGHRSPPPTRPKSFDCARCGVTVSLIVPATKAGQLKRCDSKLCDRCKRQRKWPVTVGQLARRDGTDCKICGDTVDLGADKSDLFRPSVDHITPRALGGTDDPPNLQLAHLWCNQVKNKRSDFTLTVAGGVPHGH